MASPNPVVAHQVQQPFPKLDSEAVVPGTGYFAQPWYQLFIRIWQLIGGKFNTLQTAVILQQEAQIGEAEALDVSGKVLGTVSLNPTRELVISSMNSIALG